MLLIEIIKTFLRFITPSFDYDEGLSYWGYFYSVDEFYSEIRFHVVKLVINLLVFVFFSFLVLSSRKSCYKKADEKDQPSEMADANIKMIPVIVICGALLFCFISTITALFQYN